MENKEVWKIQGSRVFGNGRSYNCTNNVTAKELQCTLNTYEKAIQTESTITDQYDKITKQIIQLKLSINILTDEINTLQGMIKNESSD